MSVAYLLWRREILRYTRSRVALIGSLVQPILYLFALGMGLDDVFRESGRGSYLTFICPGIIALTALSTSIYAGSTVLWDRRFGFLRQALVSPASRLELHLGRVSGSATVACIHATIMATVCGLAGFRPASVLEVPAAVAFLVLIAFVFASLGVYIGLLIREMEPFNAVLSMVTPPIFFLSGALYPIDGLPEPLAILTLLNPLTYGVDGLRATLISTSHFGSLIDAGVLCLLAVILTVLAARRFNRTAA
jgi:ABC-2 type transport system permease protein